MNSSVPEGFKHRLLLQLAEHIPEQVGHPAGLPASLPGGSSPCRPPMWRRRPFLAGVAAAAAASALAATLATGAASSPGGTHGQVSFTTAAWTVSAKPDGSVVVTIRDARDPAGLQARLRVAGVPATVRIASPSCHSFGGGTPETYRAVTQTYSQYRMGWLGVVHPDAIQPGHTLTILIDHSPVGLIVNMSVVATRHPLCRPTPKVYEQATTPLTSTAPSDVPSSR